MLPCNCCCICSPPPTPTSSVSIDGPLDLKLKGRALGDEPETTIPTPPHWLRYLKKGWLLRVVDQSIECAELCLPREEGEPARVEVGAEGRKVAERVLRQEGRLRAKLLESRRKYPLSVWREAGYIKDLQAKEEFEHERWIGKLLFHPTYSAAILAFLEQTVTEMLRRADNITDLSPVLYLGKRDWHKCSVYERLVTIDAAVGFLKAYEGVDLPADAGKSGLSAEEKEAIRRREAGEVEAEMDVTGESRASQTMAEQT